MTARQTARDAWQAYLHHQDNAVKSKSIVDDFYSRLALCAYFDACEEVLERTVYQIDIR
jgi:hypothetical protein